MDLGPAATFKLMSSGEIMYRSFFSLFLLFFSNVATSQDLIAPVENQCEAVLNARPTSSEPHLLLDADAWIPYGPQGYVYLYRGMDSGVSRYKYELVQEIVQINPRTRLEPLPGGYTYTFVRTDFPAKDFYRITLIHPFPKAGPGVQPINKGDFDIFHAGLEAVSARVNMALMSRAMDHELIPFLKRTLTSSRLMRNQLGAGIDYFIYKLLSQREKIMGELPDVEMAIFRALPIFELTRKQVFPIAGQGPPPKSRLIKNNKIKLRGRKKLPDLPEDEEWILRGIIEGDPVWYEYECVKKRYH